MSDDRMFSQLMTDSRPLPLMTSAPHSTSKKRVLHLSINLPEDQAEIVNRYYSLLYPTDRRATRSAFIGLAIEVLDRILDGVAPERLDASVLDAYARARADAQARTHAPTRLKGE